MDVWRRICFVLCAVSLLAQQSARADWPPPVSDAGDCATQSLKPVITYAVRYERYGVLGLYHVSLLVDQLRNGVKQRRFFIDGSGRFDQTELNLGSLHLKFRLPPAYLAGAVNLEGHKKHFFRLLTSDEFGPTYTLDEEQGTKLISMAHAAISRLDKNYKVVYCTFPFQLGSNIFWTSNSVVASLMHAARGQGIGVPNPSDGCYPGFGGPYLPSTLYDCATTIDAPISDTPSDVRGHVLLAILLLRRADRKRPRSKATIESKVVSLR